MPGTTHTQWWSQLIGESSRPTSAVARMASMVCPARSSRTALATPITAASRGGSRRATHPCGGRAVERAGEAGENGAQRLVAAPADESGAAAVVEQAMQP